MNAKNTQYLLKKHPKIFSDADKPPTESLMCFGFECGDGWVGIIDKLCQRLQRLSDESGFQVTAFQVKEKFGGLRFYVNGTDKAMDDAIDFFCEMSYYVCEVCGTTLNVSQTKDGWISTLCETDANKK